MLDGENKHSSCGEDRVNWVQQGIDFPLRKSSVRANCSVSLTGPYRPIIYKTEGYHNCLLNNSIKQWRCNLCLGSKLSSALDTEIEKISVATLSIYFFTGEITNTNTTAIASHMRLIPGKDITWDWISVRGRVLPRSLLCVFDFLLQAFNIQLSNGHCSSVLTWRISPLCKCAEQQGRHT